MTVKKIPITAPIIGPKKKPMPPMKVNSSTNPERTALTSSAPTVSKLIAVRAPAMPAKKCRQDQRQVTHPLRIVADEFDAFRVVAHRIDHASQRCLGEGIHAYRADEEPAGDQIVDLDLRAVGNAKESLARSRRLVAMPPSPPKNSGSISDEANTSSTKPSVIMAKVVPDLRVVT